MKPLSFSALASYVLAAAAVFLTLSLHLVPAALAGLLVFVMVNKASERFLQGIAGRHARAIATALIALAVGSAIVGGAVFLGGQMQASSADGLAGLWSKVTGVIEGAKGVLPDWVVENLPGTAEDVQAAAVQAMKDHAAQLQAIGKDVGVGLVHVLIGSIIGGMIAVGAATASSNQAPLSFELRSRAHAFSRSFERVVLGQGQIALINATFTAFYFAIALPLFGVHLPFLKTMVALTLVMGFVPVLGNLVSNFAIVAVSASAGFSVAVASLVFLVVVHKAEYFLAAKIMGAKINAKAWEMLCAMLFMEAAFGIAGVVAAPIIYAYIKSELGARELI